MNKNVGWYEFAFKVEWDMFINLLASNGYMFVFFLQSFIV